MRLPLRQYWLLLRRYLLPQGSRVAWMGLFLLLGIGLQVLNPQITRIFVDATRNPNSTTNLALLALFFIAAALVSSGFRALATYISSDVAWRATNALRADLSEHTLKLGMGFHKTRPPGEMIERIDGDVNALSGFFSSFVVQLGGNALLLVGVLITLTLQDWRLGLVFTLYAVLGAFVLNLTARFAEVWRQERERMAQYYGFLGEVMSATEDLRGNGGVGWVLHRIKLEMRQIYHVRVDANIKGNIVWGVSIVFWTAADILTYGFGSRLYNEGVLSIGAVYMLMHYAWMVAEPIQNFRQQLQELQRAEASIGRVEELLKIQTNLPDGKQPFLSSGALAVQLEQVDFAYEDDNLVLNSVNLKLEAGSILGLLGRTGSGKTTLARLLFRFYDPKNGSVRVGGQDVREYNLQDYRHKIALVTQDVQLFGATLRDNLTFFDSSISDAALVAALEKLGLKSWLERLPNGLDTMLASDSLSSGEAQLVALSRAFLRQPQLIILDEAGARLDPATEAQLEQALERLLVGRTAIIIAHRLKTVERASHILVLEQGKVLEFEQRLALLAKPDSHFSQLRRVGLEEVLV